MKTSIKVLIGGSILLFIAFIYFANTQLYFKPFQCPTTANEPNLSLGTTFYASSLKQPSRNDFVVFERSDTLFEKDEAVYFVFRLMALGNDTLEIKNGVVFVNGMDADADLELRRSYLISQSQFEEIRGTNNEYDPYFAVKGDSVFVLINEKFANKRDFKRGRFSNSLNSDIANYDPEWTMDDFGPLIIPEDEAFVMGDNRDNAADSRVFGTIKSDSIVAVVISY